MNPGAELELRPLRYFMVVAEELHFARAAARIRIAQPALSQAIRRLEARLGFLLFMRTSRRVTLTVQGAAFLARTRRAFEEIDRGVVAGRDIAAGRLGQVVIGHTALAMLTVLPGILRQFRARHPKVRLSLRELDSTEQIDAVRAGTIDVAIVTGSVEASELVTRRLRVDALVAALPSTYRLRAAGISVSSLAQDPFVLFPREQIPSVYDQIIAACRTAGFDPAIAQVAQSWHMIASLVAVGLGVSIVPASVERYGVHGVRYAALKGHGNVATTICRRTDATNPATAFVFDASALAEL